MTREGLRVGKPSSQVHNNCRFGTEGRAVRSQGYGIATEAAMLEGEWIENFVPLFRGQKLNTNFCFSNFSGTSGISRQHPGISRQESLISLVSRDISNFLAPTPSHGRPPPHPQISGPKSLGLGSFFVPDSCEVRMADEDSGGNQQEQMCTSHLQCWGHVCSKAGNGMFDENLCNRPV